LIIIAGLSIRLIVGSGGVGESGELVHGPAAVPNPISDASGLAYLMQTVKEIYFTGDSLSSMFTLKNVKNPSFLFCHFVI